MANRITAGRFIGIATAPAFAVATTIATAVLAAQPATAATYVFAGDAVEIPTKGPADPSFIYVEGVEGEVTKVSLRLTGLTHGYGKETMIALSNPDGWAALIWDAADCKYSAANLLFSDDAETALADQCTSGRQLPTGSYRSGYLKGSHVFTIPIAPIPPLFETLNELILPDPNGRWILWAEDFVSGDGGRIGGWELIIETNTDSEEQRLPEEPLQM